MKYLTIFALLIALIAVNSYASEWIPPDFASKKEIISQKLKDNGFSDDEIRQIFSDTRIKLYPEMLNRSGKGFNYMSRKFGLLNKKSIMRGQKVLKEHRAAFKEIEDRFGVEKEVLVAIYRVETNLGNARGNYLVFNSLLTMSVFENRRSEWATEELINLLILCKNSSKDPFSIKGSWAGAFGLCQFIPSSYLRYAVDGNGDGEIDLFNFHDAMASIASYLKAHGWEKGSPDKHRKAVWAYNHCDNYVKAVLAYARASKISKKG
ncbi:MAG: lytic murein transglycosylase [Proteobacteria bacterium]|nr:lytic murein transglycosylase [Pseudomonadota bacterium]